MLERDYQKHVIITLKKMFPGCMILKTDPNYKQGIPDLLILYKNHWGALEVKRSKSASHRPNQDHYVKKMNSMSFASFIFPENEEEVLNEIQKAFKPRRKTRVSRSKSV